MVALLTNIRGPQTLGNKISTTIEQLEILNKIFLGLTFVSRKIYLHSTFYIVQTMI